MFSPGGVSRIGYEPANVVMNLANVKSDQSARVRQKGKLTQASKDAWADLMFCDLVV
jgi:hypothetical protein